MTSPFAAPATRQEWRSDRWGRMRCLAAWNETKDVRTFLLAPEDGSRIIYEPGQFVTVRTPANDGAPVERCYTIASSAAGERSVAITVKRKPGGTLSGLLHERLVPGSSIETFGPSGRFSPATLPGEKYALVSAGSGVTPMLSIVRTAADLGIAIDAAFVHAARGPNDVIAARELALVQRRLPGLRVVQTVTRPNARWRGERGRLDAAMLTRMVPDLAERTVFCCGPEGFMETVRAAALEAGVPAERYLEESFDFGAQDLPEVPAAGPSYRVRFTRTGRSIDCPSNLTILQAAKLAGVPMPSSCAKGVCGTCKCLKTSGTVDMQHGGGIRQREIDRGFILPCSSRPTSDLVLDR